MNLEEELRAMLSQEAEMRTTPTPDLEGMVNGGQDRLRHRRTMRISLAAAAVVLIGGGAYGAAQLGDDDSGADPGLTSQPTQPTQPTEAADPPSWTDTDQGSVEPGTYRTYVGVSADGTKNIEADLTVHGSHWIGSNYPVAFVGDNFAGIGVYQPQSLAGGCTSQADSEPATAGPQQLAHQLAQMPGSDIVQPPTPTTAFGHSAVHLRLRVDAACNSDAHVYTVAETAAGSRGISYFDNNSAVSGIVLIDFWVVDVDGNTVMVDMFHTEEAPQSLVDTATAARQSITFVTGE